MLPASSASAIGTGDAGLSARVSDKHAALTGVVEARGCKLVDFVHESFSESLIIRRAVMSVQSAGDDGDTHWAIVR